MWYWSAWPAALRSGAKQDGKVSQRDEDEAMEDIAERMARSGAWHITER